MTVLPQVDGVTVTVIVIVTNVTVHLQVLGVRVMTAGEMIVGVTADGVTIVVVMIVDVTTVGVTTVDVTTVDATTVDATTGDATTVDVMTEDATIGDGMTVDVMTVDVMTVDATTVDGMTVDVMTVIDRWLGGDGIEMSGNVHQEILGVLTVIAVIGIVEAVKETALEEIVMIVIALGGGMSVQMIVIVTVIRGELEGMSQVVISGDENHPLHVLKVG